MARIRTDGASPKAAVPDVAEGQRRAKGDDRRAVPAKREATDYDVSEAPMPSFDEADLTECVDGQPKRDIGTSARRVERSDPIAYALACGNERARSVARSAVLVAPVADEDLAVELVERRTATSKTFRNPDGSLTTRLFAAQVHERAGDGTWRAVNPTVVGDGQAFRSEGLGIRSRFPASVGDGLAEVTVGGVRISHRLEGARGGVRPAAKGNAVTYRNAMPGVDVAYESTMSGVKLWLVVSKTATSLSWRIPVAVEGGAMVAVTNGIEVRDRSGNRVASIPEPVVLDAAGTVGRGSFGGNAPVTLRLEDDKGAQVLVLSVDPVWAAAKGREFPLLVDPTYYSFGSGSSEDAQITSGSPATPQNWSDQGVDALIPFGGQGCVWPSYPIPGGGACRIDRKSLHVGAWDATSRALLKYDIAGAGLMGKQITGAYWRPFWYAPAAWAGFPCADSTPTSMVLTPAVSSWSASTVTWNGQPALMPSRAIPFGYAQGSSSTSTGSWGSVEVQQLVQSWASGEIPNGGFQISGRGPSGTESDAPCRAMGSAEEPGYGPTLDVVYETPTWAASDPVSPGVVSTAPRPDVVSSSAPVFTATAASGVEYWFRVSTTPFDVSAPPSWYSSAGVNTGWISSNVYTAAPGTLRDGATYWWTVFTRLPGATGWRQSGVVRKFRVDLRVGSDATTASEQVGPVRVNLASGNVVYATQTHAVNGLAGQLGVSLTYNSSLPRDGGLTVTYTNGTAVPPETGPANGPATNVTVANIDASWGSAPPAQGIAADGWTSDWNGSLSVPVTGNYVFGTSSDDGVIVGIDGNNFIWRWFDQGGGLVWSANTFFLEAGKSYKFRLRHYDNTGASAVQLWVRPPDPATGQPQANGFVVPPSYFQQDSPLPYGWTMSAGDSGLAYRSLTTAGWSATVTDSSGNSWGFIATDETTSTFRPVTGGDTGLLVRNADSTWTLTAGGSEVVFDSGGRPTQVRTALDDGSPQSRLQYLYAGNPSRLIRITDPGSNMTAELNYWPTAATANYNASGAACVTWALPNPTAPGRLCSVLTSGSKRTFIQYSNAQITAVYREGSFNFNAERGTAAGDEFKARSSVVNFGYHTSGRLGWVREPAQTVNVLAGVQPDDANAGYWFNYDAQGRAEVVDEPKSSASAVSLRRTFAYGGAEDGFPAVTRVGAPFASPQPTSGWVRQVYFDSAGRVRAEKDLAGRRSWVYWAADRDVVTASIDPAGRMTANVVDHRGRTIRTHGPAPSTCFNGYVASVTPPTSLDPTSSTGACVAIPRTDTDYDAQNGLAYTAWNNSANPAAPSAGPPVKHGLMTFNGSSLQANWGASGSPFGLPADHFSLRMTGSIFFPAAGTYVFRAERDDGLRMTIGDTKVIDAWSIAFDFSQRGQYSVAAPGWQEITVDYFEYTGGALLGVLWTPPGQGEAHVPIANLRPEFGNIARTTLYDDGPTGNVITEMTYTAPERGLIDEVTVKNGAGVVQQRTKQTWYQFSIGWVPDLRSMPSAWDATTSNITMANGSWDYNNYVTTQTGASGCPGAAVSQFGRLASKVHPGGTLTEFFEWNGSGQLAGTRKGSSGPWTCFTYDQLGRAYRQETATFGARPGVRIDTLWEVSNNPTFVRSTVFNNGVPGRQEQSKVDWRGRQVEYWDGAWHSTATAFDTENRPLTVSNFRSFDATVPVGSTRVAYQGNGQHQVFASAPGVAEALLASTVLDASGELSSVAYGNAAVLTIAGRDPQGRVRDAQWSRAGTMFARSQQSYRRSGMVTSATDGTMPSGQVTTTYGYDALGRLTSAVAGANTWSYNYASVTAGVSCGVGARAARNGNRLSDSSTVAGVTSTRSYCYSGDDRLATGAGTPFGAGSLVFDDRGNTTTEGATQFAYNAIDQALSIGSPSSWASVVRDPQGRVADRCSNTACNSYGYSGPGDSMAWAEITPTTFQRFIGLPGGVTVTAELVASAPYFNVWAIPNLHGDTMATTDSAGVVASGPHRYDPFGKPYTAAPTQSVADSVSYGWLGQHQRLTEDQTGHIWMGARVYNPGTGRFLQVDPVEQGTPNNYTYPTDPINLYDLNGEAVSGGCGEVSIGFIWAVSFNVCYLMDDYGNELWTTSFGVGMGVEGSVGVQALYSNAEHVTDLLGWAACGDAGVGPASAGYCTWSNSKGGNYYSTVAGLTPGPLPGGGSAQAVRTWELPGWAKGAAKSAFKKMGYRLEPKGSGVGGGSW